MESSTAPQRGVDAATIAEAFRITSAQRADDVAVRTKDDEVSWTWGELRERVDALAGGLHELGLGKGDTIALMLGNRPEFHLADLAAMMVGATPFSIYMTYAPNQIEYVVSDAGARILITEQQYLANVLEARKTLPDLEHVIVIDGDAPGGHARAGRRQRARRGVDFDVEASIAAMEPDDVLTLIYTSGTTGPPKGVELAHRNLLQRGRRDRGDRRVPRGRARDLVAAQRAHRRARRAPLPADRLRLPGHDLPEPARDRVVPAVGPAALVLRGPADLGEAEGRPGGDGRRPARGAARARRRRALDAAAAEGAPGAGAASPCPEELAAAVAQADAEMFSGLRSMLGLDEVVAINVGAAPTPVEVLEFFHAIGLPLASCGG